MSTVRGSGSTARRCCARCVRCGGSGAPQGRRARCEALDAAIRELRRLELPHLEGPDDDVVDGEIVH